MLLIYSFHIFLGCSVLCSDHSLGPEESGWSATAPHREPLQDGDLVLRACLHVLLTGMLARARVIFTLPLICIPLYPCPEFPSRRHKGTPRPCPPAAAQPGWHMLADASWPCCSASSSFSLNAWFTSKRYARLSKDKSCHNSVLFLIWLTRNKLNGGSVIIICVGGYGGLEHLSDFIGLTSISPAPGSPHCLTHTRVPTCFPCSGWRTSAAGSVSGEELGLGAMWTQVGGVGSVWPPILPFADRLLEVFLHSLSPLLHDPLRKSLMTSGPLSAWALFSPASLTSQQNEFRRAFSLPCPPPPSTSSPGVPAPPRVPPESSPALHSTLLTTIHSI